MKAHLRSARIAPKKANIIAKMVRGMPVTDAIHALSRTNKKGARMVEDLLKSAVANAEHNDKQKKQDLMVKTIIVNQSMGYSRGVPKARGSIRPMMKFLSHITVTLGIGDGGESMRKKGNGSGKVAKKKVEPKKIVKKSESQTSSDSSASSASESSPKSSSQKTKTPVKKSSFTKTDTNMVADSSVSDSKAQPTSDDAPSSDSSSSSAS